MQTGFITPSDNAAFLRKKLSPDVIATELNDPNNTYILAIDSTGGSGEIVGESQLIRNYVHPSLTLPKPIALGRLYILPNLIGTGLGKALMDESDSLARKEGYESIWLTTWEDDQVAKPFYAKQGFKRIEGVREEYRIGNGAQWDWVMEKRIPVA